MAQRIDLYESGAGHLWLHPVGRDVLILMDWEASFRQDAMTYGKGWSEKDCGGDTVRFKPEGLHLIATYENGEMDTSEAGGASKEARIYLGFGWLLQHREHEAQKGK